MPSISKSNSDLKWRGKDLGKADKKWKFNSFIKPEFNNQSPEQMNSEI